MLAPTQLASANFGDDYSSWCLTGFQRECYQDSSWIDWGTYVGPQTHAGIEATLFGSYDNTNLDVAANPSGHSDTVDIWYRFEGLDDGVIGLTSCIYYDGEICDHNHVALNSDELAGMSATEIKGVACHETAHTVAVHHHNAAPGADDATGSGTLVEEYRCTMPTAPLASSLVGTHNTGHIDGYYP